jgi:hypothetical protein
MGQRSRFRNYITLEALVVVCVLLSFHFISVREKAALVAGTLFLASTIFIIAYEMKFAQFWKRLSFWGAWVFLVGAALPIFSLRVAHWGEEFAQLSLLGVSAPRMHQISNYLFLILVICFFVDDYVWKQEQQKTLQK